MLGPVCAGGTPARAAREGMGATICEIMGEE